MVEGETLDQIKAEVLNGLTVRGVTENDAWSEEVTQSCHSWNGDAHVANQKFGESYGVDWSYPSLAT